MNAKREIFPALLNQGEKLLLSQLSTEAGLSMSECIRQLILQEYASRRLADLRPANKESVVNT